MRFHIWNWGKLKESGAYCLRIPAAILHRLRGFWTWGTKRVNIMLMPPTHTRTYQYQVPVFICYGIIIAFVLSVTASVMSIFAFKYTVDTHKKNVSLNNEITQAEKRLNAQVDRIKEKFSDIDNSLERSSAFQDDLVEILGITDEKYAVVDAGLGGSGGPLLNDQTMKALSDYNRLADEITPLVDTFYEVTVSREEVLQEIFSRMKNLEPYARRTPNLFPIKDNYHYTAKYGYRKHPVSGKRHFHAGVDIAAKKGTPIYAPADGVITMAGNMSGYGKLIEIDHGFGLKSFDYKHSPKVRFHTRYGHLSKIEVKRGQRVKRGDIIGRVGSTGISTGNHLHYEIRINRKTVDPFIYMEKTFYTVKEVK